MADLDPKALGCDAYEPFLTLSGDPAVTLAWGERQRTFLLSSRELRNRMRAAIADAGGSPRKADKLRHRLEGLCYRSDTHLEVHTRVASLDGRIYVDLGDPSGRVVEVTPDGWDVVPHSPARFLRPAGMKPLPVPTREGSLDALWELVNAPEEDRVLIRAWLAAALRPGVPMVVLAIEGEQGSGKSTLADLLCKIIDPQKPPLRALPSNERDLAIMANNSHVLCFDNVSNIQPRMSDALARLATGGGFSTRRLHSDADEAIFESTRPMILTGIGNFVRRNDLADRCVFIRPSVIQEGQAYEVALRDEMFRELHPQLLGTVLDDLARGLSRLDVARRMMPTASRMADFEVFSVAATSSGSGVDLEARIAYQRNRKMVRDEALSHDVVAHVFLTWARNLKGEWIGSPTDLLELLREDVPTAVRRGWPGSPRVLTTRLKQAAGAIRAEGIELNLSAHTGRGAHKRRAIVVRPPQRVVDAGDAGDAEQDELFDDGYGDSPY